MPTSFRPQLVLVAFTSAAHAGPEGRWTTDCGPMRLQWQTQAESGEARLHAPRRDEAGNCPERELGCALSSTRALRRTRVYRWQR